MKKNKLWIPIVALLLVAVVVAGIMIAPKLSKEEVAVYSVNMVGYTDFYSGSSESYGMVTTDKIQPLYVSGTQTVTQVMVHTGQEVKKGDVLFTYDTTLSDLAVERKDLANQQLEVKLKTAQEELKELKKMKPIVYKPGSGSTTKTDYSKSPSDKKLLDKVYSTKTTGKTRTSPLYFWLSTSTQVDDAMIEYIFSEAEGNLNYVYVVFQMSSGNRANAEFNVHTGVKFSRSVETLPTDPPETTDPSDPTEPTEPSQPSEPTEPSQPPETTNPSEPPEAPAPTEPSQPPEATDPSEPGEGTQNVLHTAAPAAASVTTYAMSFFDPPSNPAEDQGTVEWNDGYTKAELESMKSEKQAEIKQLQFDIKMGKAELKIMQKEAASGRITADFDGVVQDVVDPAVALENGIPLMKVTGGGGYYVEGSVSELDLATIAVGQSVTINSWDTGMTYTGVVKEVGTYPIQDQGMAYGSTNLSFYPYTVFIDGSANLMEGNYVSMSYQTAQQASGTLYLQNAFIRNDGNRSYVYVRNPDGLLERRYLDVGVSSDGYVTPVYGGITMEDYLAFPYGKAVKDGAATFEGTDQDLYGY